MRGARLEARAPGFEGRRVELDGENLIEIELDAERPLARLYGTLRDVSGAAVAHGRVAAAGVLVDADGDGGFALDVAGLSAGDTIWGFGPGRLPARWSYVPGTESIELLLGGEAARIRGRVEDEHGRPVADAFVWAVDPTPLGTGLGAWFAETHVNPDPAAPIPFFVRSDAAGRFDLPFLLERDYRLGALERESFVAVQSAPVPAGARDVVLRLPSAAGSTPVLGRVLDRGGAPLAGARVEVHRTMVRTRDADGRELVSSFHGAARETDAEGWFELPPVPASGCYLDVSADDCFPASVALAGAGRDDVEVVLSRRMRLEVSWREHAGALSHFGVVAASGRRLDLQPAGALDASHGVVPTARVALERGATVLVLAPDEASAIVFFDGAREVERLPLAWERGGTTRVEL